MGATLPKSSTPPTSPIATTSLFTMEPFTTDQLALVKNIQFRFVDRKLGGKYDADCPSARVLFETKDDNSGTVPLDVMDRLRDVLFVYMDYACTNKEEGKQLRVWTQNFIFLNSKGRRMRNSSHVREAIAAAVQSQDTALPIYIDSSSCNTAVLLTPPRRKSVKTVIAPVQEATPVNPTPTTLKSASSSAAKSTRSRPPLAPRNLNAKFSVSSSAKKSLKKILLNKEQAASTSPAMATRSAVAKAAKENAVNDDMVVSNVVHSLSDPVVQEQPDAFLNQSASVADVIQGREVEEEKMEDDEEQGFDLEALMEGCMNEDVLMLTEPDDYSPLIVEKKEDDTIRYLPSVIFWDDYKYESKHSAPISDAEDEDHSYLLPLFFDESMSTMTTCSDGGVDMEGGSSLFNETERAILQSALDIIDGDTVMAV